MEEAFREAGGKNKERLPIRFKMEDGRSNSRMGIGNVMLLSFDFAPRPIHSHLSIFLRRTNDLRVRAAAAVSSVLHNQQYCSGARSSGTLQLSKTLGNLESMEETVVLCHISIISPSALTAVLLF